MTTFQKGDRVKVEAEGKVVYVSADTLSVKFDGTGYINNLDPKIVTKIAPAKLDWALGTVLRHRDTKSMYIRVEGGWKGVLRQWGIERVLRRE